MPILDPSTRTLACFERSWLRVQSGSTMIGMVMLIAICSETAQSQSSVKPLPSDPGKPVQNQAFPSSQAAPAKANHAIPASAFSIQRLFKPVANRRALEQEPVEAKQDTSEELLRPLPPIGSSRVPDPDDLLSPPANSDEDLLPKMMEDDEDLIPFLDSDREDMADPMLEPTQEDIVRQREESVIPYPVPDFSGPAEPVVPLPVQPAPEDFKGYLPESPGDWNLPEPRRIFPLPKVDPPTHPKSNAPSYTIDPYTGVPRYSQPMPWHSSNSSDPGSFPSLLGGTVSDHASYNMPIMDAAPQRKYSMPNRQPLVELRERLQQPSYQLSSAGFAPPLCEPTLTAGQVNSVPYQAADFAPIPLCPQPLDPQREIETYYGKVPIDTQRPWVEWWRPFYTGGMYAPGIPVFSDVNLLTPSFLVYGDYRTGVGVHRNNGQAVRSWAHRLNLDMDLRLTGTERFHMFTGPLDHNGRFTRLDFSDNSPEFEAELDFQPDTAFFEGDLGAITGGWIGDDAPFDLPFTCGLVPLLYQNGIWMEDAIAGFAVGAPWRHNRALNWANYDATFFAGFNQVTSPAFQNDNNAASVYGTAWFVEAYQGYIEMDYAYLDDLDNLGRSYHNAAIAYTRRYFGRISNSVRLIGNIGQSGPANTRSADGGLLLFENSLITSHPSTIVPYCNLFVGSGRPQSVARAGNAGGILRNTGINFETDGLTGYPTLNATGTNSYGGAIGLNMLSADFRKQWVMEFAALDTYGDPVLSAAAGPEYAVGTRYQQAINNRSLWRVDFMNGWLDGAPDIFGSRVEFRWKF